MSERNRDIIMDRERDTEKTKRGIERGRKERDCNDMIPKKGNDRLPHKKKVRKQRTIKNGTVSENQINPRLFTF